MKNLILVIFFLAVCDNQDVAAMRSTRRDSRSLKNQLDTARESFVINNSFFHRIATELTMNYIQKFYLQHEVKMQVLRNYYAPDKMDTLEGFSANGDSVSFYMVKDKSIPNRLVIQSDRATIDGDIKIGADKKLFYKKFNLARIFDVLIVEDLSGFSNCVFYFKDDKLTKIIYKLKRID